MADLDLTDLLASTLTDLDADAVAIGAAVRGVSEVVCRGGYAGTRVHPASEFYGASVTKQMLGILLARAVIDGALQPIDRVSRWLPELSAQTGFVQVQHLIHHTSGLADVVEFSDGDPSSNTDVIERFQRFRPTARAAPGTRYSYNNTGYVLLAECLSRSLDRPIADLAATTLFGPLTMNHTRLGGPPVEVPGCRNPPGTIGDGGLWVSIDDLLRWLEACNARAFGAEVHRLAETTTQLTDGSPVDYAWGVRITPTSHGRVVSHGGSWSTWQAKTVRIPERSIAVAVLGVGATASSVSDAGTGLATALAAR